MAQQQNRRGQRLSRWNLFQTNFSVMSEPIPNKKIPPENIDPSSSLPSKTTREEDINTAGQRRVNILWERTQSVVAVLIVLALIYCTIMQIDSRTMENAFYLIVSMYFVRTNHHLVGGSGPKPPPKDQQR